MSHVLINMSHVLINMSHIFANKCLVVSKLNGDTKNYFEVDAICPCLQNNNVRKHKTRISSPFTRAYARAYSQEFYAFLCHICHTNTLSHYVSIHCLASKQKFNNIASYRFIFRSVWQFFKGVFHQSFNAISPRPFPALGERCDRCDSKKNNTPG